MKRRSRLQTICDDKEQQLEAIGADSALKQRAAALESRFRTLARANKTDIEGSTKLLGAMHDFQRLEFLYHAGASDEIIRATDRVAQEKERNWEKLPKLDVEPKLCESLAGRLIHSVFQHKEGGEFPNKFEDTSPSTREQTLLAISPSMRGTAEHIVSYMLRHDIPFDTDFSDYLFNKTLIEASSRENVE
jgi:hypothetical protein